MSSKLTEADGYQAYYNGILQNGLMASGMEELELIVHELIHENNIDDVMGEKNGWQIKPVCLVDPRLIDWVKKVKKGFEEGWVKEAEQSKLFQEIKEYFGEG